MGLCKILFNRASAQRKNCNLRQEISRTIKTRTAVIHICHVSWDKVIHLGKRGQVRLSDACVFRHTGWFTGLPAETCWGSCVLLETARVTIVTEASCCLWKIKLKKKKMLFVFLLKDTKQFYMIWTVCVGGPSTLKPFHCHDISGWMMRKGVKKDNLWQQL